LPLGEDFYDSYNDDDYDLITADEFKAHKQITFLNEFVQGGLLMNLRIKGGQIYKKKNLPVIICSNYSIEECYSKSKYVAIDSLQQRFLEVPLISPIDFNNIEWITKAKPEEEPEPEPVEEPEPEPEPKQVEIIDLDKEEEIELIRDPDNDEDWGISRSPEHYWDSMSAYMPTDW
jgi:hypothetical protein